MEYRKIGWMRRIYMDEMEHGTFVLGKRGVGMDSSGYRVQGAMDSPSIFICSSKDT